MGALPGVIRIVPNVLKDRLLDEIGLTSAQRFGDGDGACGATIAPGLGGRTAYTLRVQRAAMRSAATASSRQRAANRGAGPSMRCSPKLRASRRRGFVRSRSRGARIPHSDGRDLGEETSSCSSEATVWICSVREARASAEGVSPGVNGLPRSRPLGTAPESSPKATWFDMLQ